MNTPASPLDPFIIERDTSLLGDCGAAWFSQDRTYRYLLTRCWGDPARWATFIMLNPSTADALADDPTIRRCISFAKREGCGGLQVVNLFALRATDPRQLTQCDDPVGPDNDQFITGRPGDPYSALVIVAWGAGGALLGRGDTVSCLLTAAGVKLHCLGVTAGGYPRHPLYVRADAPLIPWEPPS